MGERESTRDPVAIEKGLTRWLMLLPAVEDGLDIGTTFGSPKSVHVLQGTVDGFAILPDLDPRVDKNRRDLLVLRSIILIPYQDAAPSTSRNCLWMVMMAESKLTLSLLFLSSG